MKRSPHLASKTPATKRRFISIALLTLVMSVSMLNLAVAQTTLTGIQADQPSDSPTTITTESPEAIRNMVSRLSDQEVRALLLDRLDAVAEA